MEEGQGVVFPTPSRYKFSATSWQFIDEDPNDIDRPLVAQFEWSAKFLYSYGQLSRFFRELKDNARLMGTRCPKCGDLRCPPHPNCQKCYIPTEWIPVPSTGTVWSYTIVRSERNLPPDYTGPVPFVLSLVEIDGCDNVYPEQILEIDRPEDVKIGMRVKAGFREARLGRNTDFVWIPA